MTFKENAKGNRVSSVSTGTGDDLRISFTSTIWKTPEFYFGKEHQVNTELLRPLMFNHPLLVSFLLAANTAKPGRLWFLQGRGSHYQSAVCLQGSFRQECTKRKCCSHNQVWSKKIPKQWKIQRQQHFNVVPQQIRIRQKWHSLQKARCLFTVKFQTAKSRKVSFQLRWWHTSSFCFHNLIILLERKNLFSLTTNSSVI